MKSNKFHYYYPLQQNKNIENFSLLDFPIKNNNIRNIEKFSILDFATGDIGVKGKKGKEGNIGLMGPPGVQGSQGDIGDKGELGIRGLIGPRGPKGDKGLIGANGRDGKRGYRGPRGIIGPPGPPGDPGPPGPDGFRGLQGKRGGKGPNGPPGDQGDKGYDGHITIDYSRCTTTGWNYNHTNSGRAGNWKSETTIQCPANYIATELETECYCYPNRSGRGPAYDGRGSTPFEVCSKSDSNGMKNVSDCKHKIHCCPVATYDFPEVKKLRRDRLNLRYGPIEEERIYNIMWISMEPINLKKKLIDYPEIFNKKVSYNTNKIVSGNDSTIDSIIKFPEDMNFVEIPPTNDCESKRCSLINQICNEGKICLDKPNKESGCTRNPCWHKIPSNTDSCSGPNCNEEEIGAYCNQDRGKLCLNYINPKNNCNKPPCWHKVPILNECEGKRCAYEGQQCSGGTHNINFPGFVCLNKRNDNYASAPCSKPPCWHKIENITKECPGDTCKFVGQKCRTGGTDMSPKERICLDKISDRCNEPPCWHEIPNSVACSKGGMICTKVPILDANGKERIDYMPSVVFNSSSNGRLNVPYTDDIDKFTKQFDDGSSKLTRNINAEEIVVLFNSNSTELGRLEKNEDKSYKIINLDINKSIILETGTYEIDKNDSKILKLTDENLSNPLFSLNKIYSLRYTISGQDPINLKVKWIETDVFSFIKLKKTDSSNFESIPNGVKITLYLDEITKIILETPKKLTRDDCKSNKCEQIEATDEKGNVIKDDMGTPVMIPGDCKYQGGCEFIGQICRSGSEYNPSTKEWYGGLQKQCLNKYRKQDALPSAMYDPSSCMKKPCWVDMTSYDDGYLWGSDINNHKEGKEFVKSDPKISSLKEVNNATNVSEVYKFTPEDKEGYITKEMLRNFMVRNWMIYEANILNIDYIWEKYSNNNKMDYPKFSSMMRILNVETFKFRNGKRIVPRVMEESKINAMVSKFGMDVLGPFRDKSCSNDSDCKLGGSGIGKCVCDCPFGCNKDNCCIDIQGNVEKNNCNSGKCVY